MITLIKQYLEKSEKMRRGYLDSLGKTKLEDKNNFIEYFDDLPEMFKVLYDEYNGTSYDISKQELFDFVPGFRLMQINDILASTKLIKNQFPEYDCIIPFLTDYSSCYYAYATREGAEMIIFIDELGAEIMHDSVENFWITLNAFYDEQVYYLDEDGYLSYDFDKEGEIGKRINQGTPYWE